MSVPATAPIWTYQHSFEPTAAEFTSAEARAESAGPAPAALEPDERRRSPALGAMALLLAIAAGSVEAGAIGISVAGDYATGTVLAIVAIAASAAAVVVGIVAVSLRAGRAAAIVGAVLGVLVNPLVLVTVLGLLAGASSID